MHYSLKQLEMASPSPGATGPPAYEFLLSLSDEHEALLSEQQAPAQYWGERRNYQAATTQYVQVSSEAIEIVSCTIIPPTILNA